MHISSKKTFIVKQRKEYCNLHLYCNVVLKIESFHIFSFLFSHMDDGYNYLPWYHRALDTGMFKLKSFIDKSEESPWRKAVMSGIFGIFYCYYAYRKFCWCWNGIIFWNLRRSSWWYFRKYKLWKNKICIQKIIENLLENELSLCLCINSKYHFLWIEFWYCWCSIRICRL